MAFRRKRRFKKRRFHKRRFKRGRRGVFKKIFRKLKEVKPERKYVATTQASVEVIAGRDAICLTQIPEGSDQSERVGRKVRLSSLHIRGFCTASQVTTTTVGTDAPPVQHIRMIIIQTRSETAATDTLENTGLLVTDAPFDFYTLNPAAPLQPYKVLVDRIFTMHKSTIFDDTGVGVSGANGASAGPTRRMFHMKVRLPKKVCFYQSSVATGPHTNAIWIYLVSGLATTLAPYIQYYVRMWYTDS